jgi:hypothetical protein
MANLTTTMQRVNVIPGDGDNIVPAYVLIEKRRERAERRRRFAATIVGKADLAR